jgi:hypothetical protein
MNLIYEHQRAAPENVRRGSSLGDEYGHNKRARDYAVFVCM